MTIKKIINILSIIFLSVFLTIHTGCNDKPFFDSISPSLNIVIETNGSDIAEIPNDSTINLGSPPQVSVLIKRVELLKDQNDDFPYIIELEKGSADYSNADYTLISDTDNKYQPVYYTNDRHPEKEINYAKVYLSSIGVALEIANFNQSGSEPKEEFFYWFINDTIMDQLTFSAGDLAGFDKNQSQVLWFDKDLSPDAPLSPNPIMKLTTSVTLAGSDSNGYFLLTPVKKFNIKPNYALLLRVIFYTSNIFRWQDVNSNQGIFDGRSQDIFNWYISLPEIEIKLSGI